MNDIFEKPETMQENEHPRFYTAESVMRGHPDKLCDLIADSVLDACLQHDPASRVACEVMATHGHIIVAGEITTKVKPDVFNIVRDVLQDVGYDPKNYQIDCYIHDQSPDIAGAEGADIGSLYIFRDKKTRGTRPRKIPGKGPENSCHKIIST